MQPAALLSDLASLRACSDPSAAHALVSAHKQPPTSDQLASTNDGAKATLKAGPGVPAKDVDLQRAHDLVELHREIKENYTRSVGEQPGFVLDDDTLKAREAVKRVMKEYGSS